MTLGFTGPLEPANAKGADKPKVSPSELGKAIRDAFHAGAFAAASAATAPGVVTAASTAPASYRVVAGDTVSSIAGRFGLATASVLALNGLGWKSIIFPGQVLKLTNGASAAVAPSPAPAPPASGRYTIVSGDTISRIAARFSVSTQAVLTANGLSWTSIIYPGQTLAIPSTTAPASSAAQPIAPAPAPKPTEPPVQAAPAPAPVAPVAPVSDRYLIASGDTVSAIANRFGVSIQAILTANGLNWSSIIYTGRTLIIPGVAIAPAGATTTPLTAEMTRNAQIIVQIGKSLGVNDYGLVIALAAAMQESGLRNLNYGDRDSQGLFQQRPSAGWGTPAQITDPAYASRLFFGGVSNPNKGITRGLLDIPNWQNLTVTQAAQAVQLSAFPDAYAKWEASARVWLGLLS